ncbi:7498_t:CDS:2 [Acaulospora morrowiae]|uniref:7498_t:CDS:1 n=1 Tax=Acaulospora morrowiae TaxID=94023 RepID=A0A9N9H6I4_9GLOM|nr:7498_t:CDS:2 [Acaulospora morrowiae]
MEWGFSNILPLPYRVLIVSVVGLWAWGLNLQILSAQSLDVNLILSFQDKRNTPIYRSIYTLAIIITTLISSNLLIFWEVTGGDQVKKERHRFLRCLSRVIFSGLKQEVHFSDVILADIMTSYAKVLGDLYVAGCILLFYDVDQGGFSENKGYSYIIAPLFTRQCMAIYLSPKTTSRTQLFNALKYASAFPVIFFSALQKWYRYEVATESSFVLVAPPLLSKLWIISVAFNSFYSFYWDVAKDWKLDFFKPGLKLRPVLRFKEPAIYYLAIFIDFILRFTWSVKLSSHLHIIHQLEGGVFLMEVLEVTRRWLWIFFRMESEWIEKYDAKGYGHIENAKTSTLFVNDQF